MLSLTYSIKLLSQLLSFPEQPTIALKRASFEKAIYFLSLLRLLWNGVPGKMWVWMCVCVCVQGVLIN